MPAEGGEAAVIVAALLLAAAGSAAPIAAATMAVGSSAAGEGVSAATRVAEPAEVVTLSAAERRRLGRGEVVVRLAPADREGLREGTALAVLDTPPERVFRALVDFDHYAEWTPFVVQSSGRPLGPGVVENAQRLDLPAPVADRHYRLLVHAAVERRDAGERWTVRWEQVPGSGNVRAQRGTWTLTRLAGGRTLASCRAYVDPGGAIPAWLVNRTLARALPWVVDGLRQQAHRWRYDPRYKPSAPAGAS